ncbi:MAG: hypothetical protein NTY81_03805 [Candidatus Staskawiczbacteria bacterium]|nr:hypothetical protein [Candidatus Staskawiczbacteria bacterium]
MVSKFFSNLKKYSKGITLVEIVVMIFIIALFSLIVISDFPRIQKQYALSRAAYKLAQDLRRTQDLGLSGIKLNDTNGQPITVEGYGIYFDVSNTNPRENIKYVIYADVNGDKKYSGDLSYPFCDEADQGNPIIYPLATDCVIDEIDVSKENPSLYIEGIENIMGSYASVNFTPPDPITTIDTLNLGQSGINIVLNNGLSARKVFVNTSGLINIVP